MELTLGKAAELITVRSGHYIDRGVIYQHIKRKKSYTRNAHLNDDGNYVLPAEDVEEYASTFTGKSKIGRPRKNINEL